METFDDVLKDLDRLTKSSDKEVKKFLKKEAKQLKKKTVDTAKTRVRKQTGSYLKGIKDGKLYEFEGSYACRVYSGVPHAHLIEEGHRIVKGKKGGELGRVRGKFIFRDTAVAFTKEFEKDSEEMIEELFEKNGFWGKKMISSKDVLAILVNKLRNELEGTFIESRDVKEGYRRGSIYIYFENLRAADYMKQFRETTLNVRMIYHPKNDKDIEEILDLEEKLVEIFSDNPVIELLDGLVTEVLEVDSHKSDGDLLFNFDLYIFEEYPERVVEKMQELRIGGIEQYGNN